MYLVTLAFIPNFVYFCSNSTTSLIIHTLPTIIIALQRVLTHQGHIWKLFHIYEDHNLNCYFTSWIFSLHFWKGGILKVSIYLLRWCICCPLKKNSELQKLKSVAEFLDENFPLQSVFISPSSISHSNWLFNSACTGHIQWDHLTRNNLSFLNIFIFYYLFSTFYILHDLTAFCLLEQASRQ